MNLSPPTMSNPRLPQELLDHVVDLLHDKRGALKSCCLVSKSWIPRTRKHLFAHLQLSTPEDLRSWRDTFPDPPNSPACYARNLFIICPQVATATDVEEGGWIRAFAHVVHFEIAIRKMDADELADPRILVPFHGFSPVLESLRINFTSFPSSYIFDFINSFPLLEDLSVVSLDRRESYNGFNGSPTAVRTLSRPMLTGSMELVLEMGMDCVASRMLSLSGGLHFRELKLTLSRGSDVSLTTALVESCGSTLESLRLNNRIGPSL